MQHLHRPSHEADVEHASVLTGEEIQVPWLFGAELHGLSRSMLGVCVARDHDPAPTVCEVYEAGTVHASWTVAAPEVLQPQEGPGLRDDSHRIDVGSVEGTRWL